MSPEVYENIQESFILNDFLIVWSMMVHLFALLLCNGFHFFHIFVLNTSLVNFSMATRDDDILRSTLCPVSTRSSMRSWWMPATIFSAIRNTWLTSRRLVFTLMTEIWQKNIASQSWHGMSMWNLLCTVFVDSTHHNDHLFHIDHSLFVV